MTSRWANMPTDLLKLLSKKMTEPADYIHFRSVCHSWRSSTNRFALPSHIPLLMLPHDPTSEARPVYSLSSNQVRIISLPEMVNKIVLASNRGWLVLLDITIPHGSLSLLNPLTRDEIQLPPTTDFFHQPGYGFPPDHKMFVSADHGEHDTKGLDEYADIYPWRVFLFSKPIPINGHCMVMVANCYPNISDVAFCRVGDFAWSVLRTNLTQKIVSMACHKDKFFMMDTGANISVCKTDDPLVPILTHSLRVEPRGAALSFVTASKKLFMLVSYHEGADNSKNKKGCFKMYKVRSRMPPEWSMMESARGRALFRCEDINQSLAVRTKDIPGCRAECVYFSAPFDFPDERPDSATHEIDVLNLRTRNWEYFSCGWVKPPSGKLLPSIWLQLSLC